MQDRKLIANRWIAPDGEILQSKHQHDCIFYTCTKTGKQCMLDGGIGGYIRLSGPLQDACVYSDDFHEMKRAAFMWGSRGVDGEQPVQYNALKDLETSHIEAIITTQGHLPEYIMQMFKDELRLRKQSENLNFNSGRL